MIEQKRGRHSSSEPSHSAPSSEKVSAATGELLKNARREPFVSERPVTQSAPVLSEPYISLPPAGLSVTSTPPSRERAPRVLVVEPSTERQEVLHRLLSGEGYEVMFVGDGDEVLRLTSEWEPDLILLQSELPTTSGYEVCGELRAADVRRHTPIIMFSDQADEATIARGLLAGADDVVVDPTRLVELRARVRVQLRHKRYYDALHRVRSERDSLKRDARLDALTGVLNRRALEVAVVDRVSSHERFGVLFLDLDHFKSINDQYGHDMGDDALRSTARALKGGIRPGDVLARYGGEEFVVLVAGAGPESVRLVAERLRRAVQNVVLPANGPQELTVSVGATVFDPRIEEEDSGALLKRADKALYVAKAAGRNCVVTLSQDGKERVDRPDPNVPRVKPPPVDLARRGLEAPEEP